MNKEMFKENVYKKYQKNKIIQKEDFFNTPIYKKKKITLNKFTKMAATVVLCFSVTAGVVYGGTEIYKYLSQKPISPNFAQNSNYDFYGDMEYQDKIYYKKITQFNEYQKYKNMWPDLLNMNEDDFKQNFMIITAVENESMLGLSITNITTDENTLFIELSKSKNETEKNTIIGTKIAKEMDRQNINIKEVKVTATSNNYKNIEDIPSDYSEEQALEDKCFVIKNNKIISNNKDELDNFITDTQNNKEGFIRIYSIELNKKITIRDIEYKDKKYIFSVLNLSDSKEKLFTEEYARIEKKTSKSLGTFITLFKDDSSNSESSAVCNLQ